MRGYFDVGREIIDVAGDFIARIEHAGSEAGSFHARVVLLARVMTDLSACTRPKVRLLLPHLSEVKALRAAALMAEYRVKDDDTTVWGWG